MLWVYTLVVFVCCFSFFFLFLFFFNDTATTEIYTLSLHDALPILQVGRPFLCHGPDGLSCHGVPSCSSKLSPWPFAGWNSNGVPASWVVLPTEVTLPLSEAGEALLCGKAYPTTPPSTSITAPTTTLRPRCMNSRSPKPAMPLQCRTV